MKYDVIIPSAKKDIDFLPKVVKYIRKNLQGAQIIYIITSSANFSKIKKIQKNDPKVVEIDENDMVEGLTFAAVKKYMLEHGAKNPQVGWYFQQFLKLGFSLTKYCSGYYLSWDADTLPLKPISFFKDGKPLITMKHEYNKAYFDTIQVLIGLKKTADFSFIAEHMLFNKEIVQELISCINKSAVCGANWIQKSINACGNNMETSFSEFEMYGTFVWNNYPDMYSTRQLNTFRAAGIIKGRWIDDKSINLMAFDIDMASFELRDIPVFPYNILTHFLLWIQRMEKVKKMTFKEFSSVLLNKLFNI